MNGARDGLDVVVIGLSITSSWGNGHATTYRSLLRALAERGHRVLFLERDVPWYATNRDLPHPSFCRVRLYGSLDELKRHADSVAAADLVIVGSYVPEGAAAAEWVTRAATGATAFYDIDTPITIARLERGECDYLTPDIVPAFDLYLSFTGGPLLDRIEARFGARAARPLYCSVDPDLYRPAAAENAPAWDLGYMGTYSADRQPTLERLLLEPAREWPAGRFIVAGPQYPAIEWPANVVREPHLPPQRHQAFYTAQRFTLNVTRSDMIAAGYSPSVRLFEAAACGTPVISDAWDGLDTLFEPGREILIAETAADALRILRETSEAERRAIGDRARERVLNAHTSAHRAAQLESYVGPLLARRAAGSAAHA